MKAPVSRPTPDFGTKCPELVDILTKRQTAFFSRLKGWEAILELFRLDCLSTKADGTVNVCTSKRVIHLDR